MELEELRRVCFFATNSANFLELFFTICFHSLSRLSALLFNPFRVVVSRGVVSSSEIRPLQGQSLFIVYRFDFNQKRFIQCRVFYFRMPRFRIRTLDIDDKIVVVSIVSELSCNQCIR